MAKVGLWLASAVGCVGLAFALYLFGAGVVHLVGWWPHAWPLAVLIGAAVGVACWAVLKFKPDWRYAGPPWHWTVVESVIMIAALSLLMVGTTVVLPDVSPQVPFSRHLIAAMSLVITKGVLLRLYGGHAQKPAVTADDTQ